jgi:RNA polymerase sigma factor (sigma-70 family)
VSERTTADLLGAAAAGDRGAWDTLVERHARLVWSIARGYGLSAADAADVSQTAWLRLVEHVGRLRDPQGLVAWLATTTRHECFRVMRRTGREVFASEGDLDVETGEPTPEAVVLDSERDRLLWAALGELPQRCQVLLRAMVCAEPPSYQELAAALGMPVGSIGPTRSRCLDQLKKRLRVREVAVGNTETGET